MRASPLVIVPMFATVSSSIRPSGMAAIASAATFMALMPFSGSTPACTFFPWTVIVRYTEVGAQYVIAPLTPAVSNTNPRVALRRLTSMCREPTNPRSSPTVITNSIVGWGVSGCS